MEILEMKIERASLATWECEKKKRVIDRFANRAYQLPGVWCVVLCTDFSLPVIYYSIGFPIDWPLPIEMWAEHSAPSIRPPKRFSLVHCVAPMIPTWRKWRRNWKITLINRIAFFSLFIFIFSLANLTNSTNFGVAFYRPVWSWTWSFSLLVKIEIGATKM